MTSICRKRRKPGVLFRLLAGWRFWIGAVIAVGIAWRVLDYYLRFPVWTDEASICLNIIHRSYSGLLHPLNLQQVASLFFLWGQKFIIDHLGMSVWSLRLLPFIFGVACVPLAWWVYRPAFGPRITLLATALIACSLAPVRLTCDAKPYVIDLFFSLLCVVIMMRYLMAPERRRSLIVLTLLLPLVIGFSFSIVFVIATAALVGYTFVQMPMDIHSPYGHGYRSMITLRRIVRTAFHHAGRHTEVLMIGPAWLSARKQEPEIYWYFTTRSIPCNSSGRLQQAPLKSKRADLWAIDFWLPKDPNAGRMAMQQVNREIATSGLALIRTNNTTHNMGQIGFNYRQVQCRVEHYVPRK